MHITQRNPGKLVAATLCIPLLTGLPQDTLADISCNKPNIFFVNGVWNPKGSDAVASQIELQVALNEALESKGLPPTINIRTIWNEGDGYLADIEEVSLDQPILYLAIRNGLQLYMDAPAATERRRRAIDKVKSIVIDSINSTSAPVILIAHSQGNIVVNNAVRELQNDAVTAKTYGIKNIGIIGVGVADKDIGITDRAIANRHYSYITSTTDLIIAPLPGVLPSNFKRTVTLGDISDFNPLSALRSILDTEHSFVPTYLNENHKGIYKNEQKIVSSREVVRSIFLQQYMDLISEWPCVELKSGPNPVKPGKPVQFTVSVKPRPGYFRQYTGQAVVYKAPIVEGAPMEALCTVNELNKSGVGSCLYTFNENEQADAVVAKYLDPLCEAVGTCTSTAIAQTFQVVAGCPVTTNNLRGTTVSTSSSLYSGTPSDVVDGSYARYVNLSGFTGWFDFQLPSAACFTKVVLYPSASPSPAASTIQLSFWDAGGTILASSTHSVSLVDGGRTEILLPAPVFSAQKVRVQTLSSQSWVGWFEVEGY